MIRLGWFSSGRDKAARQLLEVVYKDIKDGGLEAEIEFVFCSQEAGETPQGDLFLALVRGYTLPLVAYSYRRFRSRFPVPSEAVRLAYDQQVMERLRPFHPHLCVLAGYMLILSPAMCQRYKIINLHPAAPGGPKGTWQEVIWQLMGARAATSGVMMHLVTPELDAGPPVTYCTYSLRGPAFDPLWQSIEGRPVARLKSQQGENHPLFRLIRQEGLKREFPLILATLRAFGRGQVRIERGGVVDAQGRPLAGYDLTAKIEAMEVRA